MDILQLYQDFDVDFKTEGHKHCRPGWVNIECPFCVGNPGYHLGFEIQSAHYFCWRCGWHPTVPTLATVLHVTFKRVKELVREYNIDTPLYVLKEKELPASKKEYLIPPNAGPLTTLHRKYLEGRNFDPDKLIREWNLVGTGPISRLDGLDLKLRIIIPIIWDLTSASWTSRDATDKRGSKYITCPKDRERIFHKSILYGRQELWGKRLALVEGPTDVWRFGTNAGATFGIEYTSTQLRYISKNFERVAVCYDDDPQAIMQANKLVGELKFRGVDAFRVSIEGDPGSMNQKDADYLMKQLI